MAGTSTDPVVAMYENDLEGGEQHVSNISITAVQNLMISNYSSILPNLTVSSDEVLQQLSEEQSVAVILHNSLAWEINTYYNILVPRKDLSVFDSNGTEVTEAQVNPTPQGKLSSTV